MSGIKYATVTVLLLLIGASVVPSLAIHSKLIENSVTTTYLKGKGNPTLIPSETKTKWKGQLDKDTLDIEQEYKRLLPRNALEILSSLLVRIGGEKLLDLFPMALKLVVEKIKTPIEVKNLFSTVTQEHWRKYLNDVIKELTLAITDKTGINTATNENKGKCNGGCDPEEDFWEYYSLYQKAKKWRFDMDYHTWYKLKLAQVFFLPVIAIGAMGFGAAVATSLQDPMFFWIFALAGAAVDALLEAYFQVVTGWEEELTVESVDIVLHVIDKSGKPLEDLQIYAYNELCHGEDDNIGADFHIPQCANAEEKGWYVMSCRETPYGRNSPAPGYWNITIYRKVENKWIYLEHCPICKGETYCKEIVWPS